MSLNTIAAITTAALLAATLTTTTQTTPAAPATAHAETHDTADDVTVVAEAILAASPFDHTHTNAATTSTSATSANASAAVAPECQDKTYALAPWRLPATFTWSYNPTAAPASVATTALPALRTANTTLFNATTHCTTNTTTVTTDVYAGTTTTTAQVSPQGTCTGNDNISVTSWGALPPKTLAYTCVYYRTSTKTVLAADVLIDNKLHKWFTTKPANCTNQFDLQSVMVHERGHTAGLDHVDQTTHNTQAMAPKTPACSTTNRTLAAGDAQGLKAKYTP